jgi:hypothetical protein
VKRGGVGARNYVLHIGKSYTAAQKGDAYYIEAPKIPSGAKTWCGRRVDAVNCASMKCAYSKDELCVSCLGKARACEETTA